MQFIYLLITAISALIALMLFRKLRLVSKELLISKRLLQEEINNRIAAESELKEYSDHNKRLPGENISYSMELKNTPGSTEIEKLKPELAREKKSNQELLESNNRFQLALDASENGFADILLDGSKPYFSPILLKQLGYSLDELLGLVYRWKDYIHMEDIDNVNESVSGLLSGQTKSAEFTHRVLTSSGHWKWFLTKIKIISNDETASHERMFIVTEDVSLRKKAEEEILLNLAKEQELAEMRSRLVTLVSHEFRTPISTILSSVELIETYGDRLTKEKAISYFDKIKKSIDYLVSLLNEISLMSKTETSALVFKPEKVELISLINELIEELKSGAKVYPNIHLNANRKIFHTQYDTKLFRYIFTNLLSNAIKYTDPSKNIFIYCIFNPSEIFFSVTDEGIGVPKDEQKSLFVPFNRASNVGEIKGSGLGLSIVKKTVEVCHGKIFFESELNKGTSFKVILPIITNQQGI